MKFKAAVVFLCLLMSGSAVLDEIGNGLWITVPMMLGFAAVL